MLIQNQWSSSTYNIAVNVDRHVGDLQLVDEKQKMLQIGAGANGLIVIHVVLNQILQMITNHGTDIERSHRERWERVVKSHVVELLDWYGDLNLCGPMFGDPETKIARYLNVTDHIIEFDKTNSEHGILIIENCRDNSCSNFWCKIRSN